MNKLKKQIARLDEYLGKDVEGKRLLEDISRTSNELRKDRAAEKEKNESLRLNSERLSATDTKQRQTIQTLRDEIDKHKNDIGRLRRDLKNKNQEIDHARAELKKLEIPDLPTPECDKKVEVKTLSGNSGFYTKAQLDVRSFTAMFNSLRKEMKVCPAAETRRHQDRLAEYELFDIVKGYSESEMIKLGKFVASMAVLNISARVTSSITFTTHQDDGYSISENTIGKFVRWWAPRNINMKDMVSLARKGDKLIENTGKVVKFGPGEWGYS